MNASSAAARSLVPDGRDRLVTLSASDLDLALVVESLRQDAVVLIRHVAPERADVLLQQVTEGLGLLDRLHLQAACAALLGHRQRIGKYRMTVNKRADYQFIPPHSEGDSFLNMQLACFYCVDNSTDGGENILMNVDDASTTWQSLREKVTRIAPGSKPLTTGELKQSRALYHLHDAAEVQPGDRVIRERSSQIPGLKLVDVLAPMRKARSSILDRDLYAYWVSIAIMDHDSLHFFVSLLKQTGLLRAPAGGLELRQMDNVAEQRLWSSGADYSKLFKCQITHKLARGDLLLQNNLTWTHAASNWTPGSGVRQVTAAFA